MTSLKLHWIIAALSVLIFASCSEDITGSSTDFNPNENLVCTTNVRDYFNLDMPCTWDIVNNHEETNEIGIIRTGDTEIYFQFGTFKSLDEVIGEATETYYYPLLDGRMVFVVSEVNGRELVSCYFESFEQEGGSVTLEFWFAPRDDGKMIMNVLRTLRFK